MSVSRAVLIVLVAAVAQVGCGSIGHPQMGSPDVTISAQPPGSDNTEVNTPGAYENQVTVEQDLVKVIDSDVLKVPSSETVLSNSHTITSQDFAAKTGAGNMQSPGVPGREGSSSKINEGDHVEDKPPDKTEDVPSQKTDPGASVSIESISEEEISNNDSIDDKTSPLKNDEQSKPTYNEPSSTVEPDTKNDEQNKPTDNEPPSIVEPDTMNDEQSKPTHNEPSSTDEPDTKNDEQRKPTHNEPSSTDEPETKNDEQSKPTDNEPSSTVQPDTTSTYTLLDEEYNKFSLTELSQNISDEIKIFSNEVAVSWEARKGGATWVLDAEGVLKDYVDKIAIAQSANNSNCVLKDLENHASRTSALKSVVESCRIGLKREDWNKLQDLTVQTLNQITEIIHQSISSIEKLPDDDPELSNHKLDIEVNAKIKLKQLYTKELINTFSNLQQSAVLGDKNEYEKCLDDKPEKGMIVDTLNDIMRIKNNCVG